jgi:hypothetical protein
MSIMCWGQGVPTPRKVSQISLIASPDWLAAVAAGAGVLAVDAAAEVGAALVVGFAGAELVFALAGALAAGGDAAGWDEQAASAAELTMPPAMSPRIRRRLTWRRSDANILSPL